MANTKTVAGGCRGHCCKGWNSVDARELEHSGRVVDDVDVDVPAFQRIHSCTSIDRILILVHLDDIIQLVRPILVPSEIIQVEPVSLSALSSHNSNAFDISARELAG